MKPYLTTTILLATALLAGCTADLSEESGAAAPPAGLALSFGVGGLSTTRAGVSGTAAENAVSELDAFVFGSDGSFTGHDYTDAFTMGQLWQTKFNPDAVTDGSAVYLVANAHTIVKDITTLDDLQAAQADVPVNYNSTGPFLMDAKVEVSPATKKLRDGSSTEYVLSGLTLKRSVAKIRLRIMLENADGTTTNVTNSSETTFQIVNFAKTGLVVNDDSYDFASTVDLYSLPETIADGGAGMLEAKDIVFEGSGDDTRAVFYSYPNEWYDGTKNPVVEEMINKDRQTYIMIRTLAIDGKPYYYKVPVNFRLPDYNDQVNLDRSYFQEQYQLKRNYIYDIKATIDRTGGENGFFVQYDVKPWQNDDNESYTLNDFYVSDSLTAVKTIRQYKDPGNGVCVAVAYSADNNKPLSSMLRQQLTTTTKWIMHIDNPNFQFLIARPKVGADGKVVYDEQTNEPVYLDFEPASQITNEDAVIAGEWTDGSLSDTSNKSVRFYVVPKTDIDPKNPTRNYHARIFLSVPSSEADPEAKKTISTPLPDYTFEADGSRPVYQAVSDVDFYQVSPEEYNKLAEKSTRP